MIDMTEARKRARKAWAVLRDETLPYEPPWQASAEVVAEVTERMIESGKWNPSTSTDPLEVKFEKIMRMLGSINMTLSILVDREVGKSE